jgi:hypothetical protein
MERNHVRSSVRFLSNSALIAATAVLGLALVPAAQAPSAGHPTVAANGCDGGDFAMSDGTCGSEKVAS